LFVDSRVYVLQVRLSFRAGAWAGRQRPSVSCAWRSGPRSSP